MLFNLSEYSSESIHYQLSSQIIMMIRNGDLLPDDNLWPAHKLAESQHISLTTVRKSYRMLEEMGLISITQNGSCRVTCSSTAVPIDRQFSNQQKNRLKKIKQQTSKGFNLNSTISKIRLDDLEKAREIQQGLFPRILPDNSSVRIKARCQSSHQIGGDLYDAFYLDRRHVVFLVADACGTGLAAALLIAQLRSAVRSSTGTANDPAALMNHLNRILGETMPRDRFISMFLAVYAFDTYRLTYVNAGHPQPLLLRDVTGTHTLIETNPALGLIKNHVYRASHMTLYQGQLLTVYTDGLTESMNALGMEFGEDRLGQLLHKYFRRELPDIINSVFEDVSDYSRLNGREDDKTILLFKVMQGEV